MHQRNQLANSMPINANKQHKGKRKSVTTGGNNNNNNNNTAAAAAAAAAAAVAAQHFNSQFDKMLTDRMLNIADNKKFCDNPSGGGTINSVFYEKSNKCNAADNNIVIDYVKNGGASDISVNNNNNIKSERLSPSVVAASPHNHHNGGGGGMDSTMPNAHSSG